MLWLFTDSARLPDPLPAVAALPRGLCGVVFRHDGAPDRAETGVRLMRLCRERGLPLVVAGDTRLAARLGAGVHLRGGRWPDAVRRQGLVTASAHGVPELRRARRAGAAAVFLSPLFPTASHPAAPALGSVRWRNIARHINGLEVYCLGGVNGVNVRILGRFSRGAGAITALNPEFNISVT